jgi:peptidyl-prolyl cis-trans isomerase B (cyclophilin B)
MIKNFFALLMVAFLMACSATRKIENKKFSKLAVNLSTDSGTIVLRLYNKTPQHRDNFIKLVKEHYFDSLLFHRVIKNFMIQGGDPNSKNAKPAIQLGNGSPGYTLPAEFDTSLFHKKGVLAAAREGDNVNPTKASSGSQFYIVQGKKFTDAGLDSVETFRLKGRKLPIAHREVYKTIGGTPHLDMNYTIFGEVESGLEVVDKIASAVRDTNNRPLNDIKMKMRIFRKR